MRKFLNISLLLLLLGLSGSLSCEGLQGPEDISQSEPNFMDELDWSQALEGEPGIQTEARPFPSERGVPAGREWV